MSVAKIITAQPEVISGTIVSIEADLSRGLHSFSIVGLAGKAIDESKDRVSSAIKHSGYKSPKSSNHKITISLSPADLKKEGPLYDLPIALAYLAAAEEIIFDSKRIAFVGELGLDGNLRGVKGVLPIVHSLQKAGIEEVVVPQENAEEAALIEGIIITPASSLQEVIKHLDARHEEHQPLASQPRTIIPKHWNDSGVMLEDIKGQEGAKRGLQIAAAGKHNLLMVGPPGTGKTMLARAFQNILPPLNEAELLSVLSIHSHAGILRETLSSAPPFRAPHHTASHTSLVGGGVHPRPGEVTLAHHGVLFMDEFPEFERRCLDALRQPLEDRVVSISRVQGSAIFPADFILLAAMNPYRGTEDGTTDYAASMVETYKNKISGPILDRIDLWIQVPHVDYDTLTAASEKSDETNKAREQILNARERAKHRLKETGKTHNAAMSSRDIENLIPLSDAVHQVLKSASLKLNLSPRAYHRIIKVARTIADLEDCPEVETKHVLEALQYRVKL